MDFWDAFSDEFSKVAEASNVKRVSSGSVPHFKSPEEVEKYRQAIRQHLGRPEVAARIAERRNRVGQATSKRVKGKGKIGALLAALTAASATGTLGGYLLGRHSTKYKVTEGNANESA